MNDIPSRLTNVEQSVTNFGDTIETFRTKMNELDEYNNVVIERITEVNASLADLTNRVSTNETDISGLKNRVSTNENNIKDLQTRMGTAETNITTNKNNITSLTTRMGNAENNISGHEGRLDGHDADIAALRKTDESIDSNIKSMQSTQTNHENRIVALESYKTANDKVIAEMKAADTANAADIAEANYNIGQLLDADKDINQKISDHETKYTELKKSVDDLINKVNKADLSINAPLGTIMYSVNSPANTFTGLLGGTWDVVGNIQALVGDSETITLYMFKKTGSEDDYVDPGMGIPTPGLG